MEKGLINSGITGTLLAAEKLRSSDYRVTRLYPAVTAILNLLFAAYFERYLKNDVNGYHLSVFLFLECSAYVVISSISFVTTSSEILAKSRIFPITPFERLLFVITSNLRRPMILAFAGSNIFFIIIIYPDTFWNAIAIALLFIVLILLTETLLTTILLGIARRSIPQGGAFALFAFCFLAFLVGSLVFHMESILPNMPILNWTVTGILAGSSSDIGTVLMRAFWLLITELCLIAVARRAV